MKPITKKEARVIRKRATLVGIDYKPKTVEECVELYKKAEAIAEIAGVAIENGLRDKASARK